VKKYTSLYDDIRRWGGGRGCTYIQEDVTEVKRSETAKNKSTSQNVQPGAKRDDQSGTQIL
jgi:hypothetical protein